MKKDGLWGFIDSKGDWVVEPDFKKADPFTDGYAKVALEDKKGCFSYGAVMRNFINAEGMNKIWE